MLKHRCTAQIAIGTNTMRNAGFTAVFFVAALCHSPISRNASAQSSTENSQQPADFYWARYYAGKAAVAQQQRKWDIAESHLRSWIDYAPNDTAAHRQLGEVLFRRGKIAEAAEQFHKLFDMDANFAQAEIEIARLYYDQGNYGRCQEWIELALHAYPDDPRVKEQAATAERMMAVPQNEDVVVAVLQEEAAGVTPSPQQPVTDTKEARAVKRVIAELGIVNAGLETSLRNSPMFPVYVPSDCWDKYLADLSRVRTADCPPDFLAAWEEYVVIISRFIHEKRRVTSILGGLSSGVKSLMTAGQNLVAESDRFEELQRAGNECTTRLMNVAKRYLDE